MICLVPISVVRPGSIITDGLRRLDDCSVSPIRAIRCPPVWHRPPHRVSFRRLRRPHLHRRTSNLRCSGSHVHARTSSVRLSRGRCRPHVHRTSFRCALRRGRCRPRASATILLCWPHITGLLRRFAEAKMFVVHSCDTILITVEGAGGGNGTSSPSSTRNHHTPGHRISGLQRRNVHCLFF